MPNKKHHFDFLSQLFDLPANRDIDNREPENEPPRFSLSRHVKVFETRNVRVCGSGYIYRVYGEDQVMRAMGLIHRDQQADDFSRAIKGSDKG